MVATYSRLKSGNWGVRVRLDNPFEEAPKGTIEVTKKDGSTKQETLKTLVWSGEFDGDSVYLYALD